MTDERTNEPDIGPIELEYEIGEVAYVVQFFLIGVAFGAFVVGFVWAVLS